MSLHSINPATGKTMQSFPVVQDDAITSILESVTTAQNHWEQLDFDQRATCFTALARLLRQSCDKYAGLITEEMGKLLKEARAEVEKCALGCEYFAEHAADFLADESLASDAGHSYVAYQPLGIVLCIMPWNYPFWQVIRAAAPAMMAGNAVILKHASNVPRCALALEEIFREAGFPENIFRSLLISSTQVEHVIASEHVAAVTLTGSEAAGQKVAATAGSYLKKCVLELGGSDPFIILADADIAFTAEQAVTGRFQNMGQSCIAAKRFILVDSIADEFIAHFEDLISQLRYGDPMDNATSIAPMARADLRDELHDQVERSLSLGAKLITGGAFIKAQGAYYAPTILDRVRPGMPAFDEELFGPVAAFVRVRDVEDAIMLANQTRFGLGASVWTKNTGQGEAVAKRIHAGCTFVNGIVKSDPRLPFGGVKHSGFGRELSSHGIREFVNVKTVWIK
ncbi:NAD-dependent succinate-semialdehyde dehydrogenase [Nitrosomonas sp.]|uniref:NAD-dependent succinate-semialdehyde dehydrogenase n=1 Tax=Nitrosomonas sp. TaxID=42353 RepID=UPI001D6C29E0|nr:NAD-dependent succinate-semialdehyde dehydrogenase [Nitrosomonas sp.]MCB1947537.1 NAD-dependent succinate-semialdehyde dehydrogenase [Nitrosomonas sp.]